MSQFDEFRKFLRRDVPLAMHTRLQLGGPAEFFAEPTSETELLDILKQSRNESVPVRAIGSGTSILPGNEGVSGVVLSLAAPVFCGITVEGNCVTAGAGEKLGRVVTQSVAQGLSGIENLVGIPGTVGGALRGNVGTNSGDLGQWVESVKVVDFNANVFELSRNEVTFGYRTSSLDDVIILSATLVLRQDDVTELAKRLQKIWIVRKTQQPTGERVSGYMFKNPQTGSAARELIERAGRGDAWFGLDVHDPEPIPVTSPLRSMPNVFLSPHIAGVTEEAQPRFFAWMVDELNRWQAGAEPRAVLTDRTLAGRGLT